MVVPGDRCFSLNVDVRDYQLAGAVLVLARKIQRLTTEIKYQLQTVVANDRYRTCAYSIITIHAVNQIYARGKCFGLEK